MESVSERVDLQDIGRPDDGAIVGCMFTCILLQLLPGHSDCSRDTPRTLDIRTPIVIPCRKPHHGDDYFDL